MFGKAKVVLPVLALILTLVLSACTAPQAAKPQGEVYIYTSVPEALINELTARFQAKYPDVTPKVYRAGTPDIIAKLTTEARAGGVKADVVWVAEITAAEDLKEKGMLRAYKSAEAGNIPAHLKSPAGYYYGSRLINMVLAYNTRLVTQLPTTWKDMLDPAHKGKIGLPSPSGSGSALYAVGSMVDHPDFGWKFFEDMRANGGVQLKNNSEAVQKVAAGELHLAIALDFQIKNLRDGGSPIDYVVPAEGLVMVASPIALLKNSPNPRGGEVFLDYVLSRECQEFMAQSQSVVPVRTDVTPPAGVPSLAELKAMKSNSVFIKENRAQILERFTEIFTK
jgi:iron(III) transport system substrate-binding protein